MVQQAPLPASGPGSSLSPQVARFKAAHYVVNYLELAAIVADVVFDLLGERRSFTIHSGDRVRDAFDIDENDIVTRWASVSESVLRAMTPENADTIGYDTPRLWPALFHFLDAMLNDQGLTGLFLLWIRTAMNDALPKEDEDEAQDEVKWPVLYQFQLNLLEQWYLLPHEGDMGVSFDQLLQLLQAVAAFRAIIDEVLSFSFEDLAFTETIAGSVQLEVDGVVAITLPEDPAAFLSWDLDGDDYRITLHFEEIAMAGDSEFALVIDNPYTKLRFPFGGTTNALRFMGVAVSLVVDPQHSTAHPAPFAPYHQFSDAYFTQRPGKQLARLEIDIDDVSFSLASTTLTALFSAAAAYIDLWTSDKIGDLGTALGEVAAAAVRNLDDIGGVAGALSEALEAIFPNALACSTHDLHKPYQDSHYGLRYEAIRARAEDGALIVTNEGPPAPQPPDFEPDTPTHFPPPDVEVYWPGLIDREDPLPPGGGGSRPSLLRDPARLDAVRIQPAYRAEYERRLAAAGSLSPRGAAAARLLIDGLSLRTVRFLNQRQINPAARTVAGVPVAPATLKALERLAAGRNSRGFLFAVNGQVASPAAMFAEAFTPLTKPTTSEPYRPLRQSIYAAESTLAARRGLAVDPGWLGLSVNSYAVDAILRVVAASPLMTATGEAATGTPLDPASGPPADFTTAPSDALQLYADLSGDNGAGPVAVVEGLDVTLSRGGATARYRVAGRMPLAATRTSAGCLPDAALLTIVQYAGCIERLTGGAIAGATYRDELLYRHFVFLEPRGETAVVTGFDLLEGEPGKLGRDQVAIRPLLAAALRGVWAQIGRVPVVFDPFYGLSPVIDTFEARGGWLNVYQRYGLT